MPRTAWLAPAAALRTVGVSCDASDPKGLSGKQPT